ncbi:MAG: hypothetical protein R2867_02320 [Caldilineaceae bacterium]
MLYVGAGEYFRTAWVDKTGAAGVLADSVEYAKSAPVYVQQGDSGRRVGFAALAEAAERPLLRMPGPAGIALLKTQAPLTPTVDGPIVVLSTGDSSTVTETVTSSTRSLTASQLQTVGWALRNASTLNFGPCDQLQEIVPAQAMQPAPNDSELRARRPDGGRQPRSGCRGR